MLKTSTSTDPITRAKEFIEAAPTIAKCQRGTIRQALNNAQGLLRELQATAGRQFSAVPNAGQSDRDPAKVAVELEIAILKLERAGK